MIVEGTNFDKKGKIMPRLEKIGAYVSPQGKIFVYADSTLGASMGSEFNIDHISEIILMLEIARDEYYRLKNK